MSVDIELVSDLADRIVSKRKKDIYDSFFEDAESDKPHTEKGIYGRTWTDADGHKHHQMLINGRWQRNKVGKKAKPMKSEMKKQIDLGNKLIKSNSAAEKTSKKGISDGVEIKLAYEGRLPSEYANSSFQVDSDGKVEANGKMGSLEKDIVKCVSDWASENGLTITISSLMQ